jgi:hypothetical protein
LSKNRKLIVRLLIGIGLAIGTGVILVSILNRVATGARPESNVEVLYRFPLVPKLDMTISYMGIIHPALDPTNSYASAFSLRFVSVF